MRKILATLLNSQTPKQFLEKKEVRSKKRREIERYYCLTSVVNNVKLSQ